MQITTKILNDKELMAKFKKSAAVLQGDVDKALLEGGKKVKESARKFVRIKTGATRDSMFEKLISPLVQVGAKTDYAASLEKRYPFLHPALIYRRKEVIKIVHNRVNKTMAGIFKEGYTKTF